MAMKIFVNLPVADLDRAKLFYSAGFVNEPKFSDEAGTCMVASALPRPKPASMTA